jgi:hypothetical protein
LGCSWRLVCIPSLMNSVTQTVTCQMVALCPLFSTSSHKVIPLPSFSWFLLVFCLLCCIHFELRSSYSKESFGFKWRNKCAGVLFLLSKHWDIGKACLFISDEFLLNLRGEVWGCYWNGRIERCNTWHSATLDTRACEEAKPNACPLKNLRMDTTTSFSWPHFA